jgi:hypothetical protein
MRSFSNQQNFSSDDLTFGVIFTKPINIPLYIRPVAKVLTSAAKSIDPALEVSLVKEPRQAISSLLASFKIVSRSNEEDDQVEITALNGVKGDAFARIAEEDYGLTWKWKGSERLVENWGSFESSAERRKYYGIERGEDAFEAGSLYGFEFYGYAFSCVLI